MKYYSTNRQSEIVGFKEATIKGQAPDKGLYFPETIPQAGQDLIKGIENRAQTSRYTACTIEISLGCEVCHLVIECRGSRHIT